MTSERGWMSVAWDIVRTMMPNVQHRGAWMPAGVPDDESENRLIEWVANNVDMLRLRVTLLPSAQTSVERHRFLKAFAGKGTTSSHRSFVGSSAGGPVTAAWPTETHMYKAIRATPRGQVLVCLDSGFPSFEGWACAVRAFNARTGETEIPLEAGLLAAVETLLFWDREIGGGAQRGEGRDRIHAPLRDLIAAGLSEDFVATYCLALGLHDFLLPKLRNHYQACK
ncbi:hypothetical protein HQO46_16435 [Rhodococcus fascians]|nr:hypothetical protein [Rhodococcus fascians]MBY4238065.1 hypothetical protein [Rhodococcus fascians]